MGFYKHLLNLFYISLDSTLFPLLFILYLIWLYFIILSIPVNSNASNFFMASSHANLHTLLRDGMNTSNIIWSSDFSEILDVFQPYAVDNFLLSNYESEIFLLEKNGKTYMPL